jgi:uncharacterized BrkB/YihY/UPF0761 family membrane protein
VIVALFPLAFLGLALLAAFGLGHLWADTLVPGLRGHVTPEVFRVIDATAEKIVRSGIGATVAIAGLLSVWYLTASVRAVMEALNRIHDVDADRDWRLRGLLALGLGTATGAAVVDSFLLLAWGSTVSGSAAIVLDSGRWITAVLRTLSLVGQAPAPS